MLKKFLILLGIVFFLSCGGGSSKEAKELLQKILTIIGIPPSVITNVCQTSNQSDICEGMTLNVNKPTEHKTKRWQKIKQTDIGQYLLETNIPCEPILLELQDGEVVDDNGEFFLKFSGVELGVKEKELSILEAMVDASYLSSSSVSSIKTLNSTEAQNSFYARLYSDLKTNINKLRAEGLTKTQAIRGTLKEMAEELKDYGVESTLPDKLNGCSDTACVESELDELSSKLLIYASETDAIVEAQKDNNAPLGVREVSCEEENLDLNKGLVAYYKFEGNAKDSSGNGYHGTEYGNINYTIGVVEKSLNLNGSGHINTSLFEKSFLSIGDPIAISVWFKSKQNTTSSHKAIISGNGGGPDFGAYVNSSNFITRTYGGDNGVHNIEVDDNKWHYLVFGVTHDSTTFTYLDGVKLSTSSTIGNYARDEFQIGGTRNGEYRYNGSIDDLRIYNRALTDTEIQELYKMGSQ